MQTKIYKNKKNLQIYRVVDFSVRNATNSNPTPDIPYVLYCNKYGEHFVRERKEFEEKFQEIDCHNCVYFQGWCEGCIECQDYNKYLPYSEVRPIPGESL